MVAEEVTTDQRPRSAKNTLAFDVSKAAQLTPSDGYRVLQRRLKTAGWKVIVNKEEISDEFLASLDILIIASPRARYTETEFMHLRKYVQTGGKLLVLLSEGGEKRAGTNINFLLEEFGVSVNNDAVVRTSYYKYFHPKECLINNGILNRTLVQKAQSLKVADGAENGQDTKGDLNPRSQTVLSYVYPYGATLNVQKPSVAVLSTGSDSYPIQRPTVAFYSNMGIEGRAPAGRLVVIGSSHVFHDNYIEKEDNGVLKDIIFEYLTAATFVLNPIDAKDPEVSDYHALPDLESMTDQPFCCLQEGEELPSDYNKLFSKNLYSLDNSTLTSILEAYEEMNMEYESLKLIKPQFETPLPALQPAVFPANFRIPAKPSLELFDLDDAFSSSQTRLSQIANKCDDTDLEYYVKEAALVLGISDASTRTAKSVLFDIFARIVEYKKINVNEERDLD